jgi:hypothetical protein
MARTRRTTTLKSKRGDELTDEVVQALADEAERGYDLEGAERVRVGRPSLAGGGRGVSPQVNVRIPRGNVRGCAASGPRGIVHLERPRTRSARPVRRRAPKAVGAGDGMASSPDPKGRIEPMLRRGTFVTPAGQTPESYADQEWTMPSRRSMNVLQMDW